MMYMDVWRSGTFPKKQQKMSALPIANTERSTTDSLGDVSAITALAVMGSLFAVAAIE